MDYGELLPSIKLDLNIDQGDSSFDAELRQTMKVVAPMVRSFCGLPDDYEFTPDDGAEWVVFASAVLYKRSAAMDEFDNNYRGCLTPLLMRSRVRSWEASNAGA